MSPPIFDNEFYDNITPTRTFNWTTITLLAAKKLGKEFYFVLPEEYRLPVSSTVINAIVSWVGKKKKNWGGGGGGGGGGDKKICIFGGGGVGLGGFWGGFFFLGGFFFFFWVLYR
jgi:hypothetical protein